MPLKFSPEAFRKAWESSARQRESREERQARESEAEKKRKHDYAMQDLRLRALLGRPATGTEARKREELKQTAEAGIRDYEKALQSAGGLEELLIGASRVPYAGALARGAAQIGTAAGFPAAEEAIAARERVMQPLVHIQTGAKAGEEEIASKMRASAPPMFAPKEEKTRAFRERAEAITGRPVPPAPGAMSEQEQRDRARLEELRAKRRARMGGQ